LLRKDISKLGLLFTAVGGIVGSGWLLGPFYAAKMAGPAAMLAWLLGGLLMMVIALTFAELSSTYPVAGGLARFAQFSHGTLTSFTIAWIAWLAAVMVAPIETMAAIQYASNYVPALVHASGAHQLTGLGVLVAAGLMLLLCIVNSFAVKYFAKSNVWLVSWKLLVPVVTGIILVSYQFHWQNFVAGQGFFAAGWHGVLAALPAAGVIFSFIGYSPAIQLAGEAKNPGKAIPFAIIGSLLLAILLYVMIEVVFIAALPASSLQHGWQALNYANDTGPIAGMLATLGVVVWLAVIYADAIVSPVGTAFIYTAATARVNMAMSHNGYMPQWIRRLNRHGSPVYAILVNFVVGLLFFLPFPRWQTMVSFIVSCFVLAYAIGPLACVVLRRKDPERPRPFRVPYAPIFCFIAFYVCNLIIYWTGWQVVWKMLVTLVLGYVLLLIEHQVSERKKSLNVKQGIWLLPYFAGLALLSYWGNFGGKAVMGFGVDFLYLAGFSLLIYMLAYGLASPEPLPDLP
jgi:amino acid transporter